MCTLRLIINDLVMYIVDEVSKGRHINQNQVSFLEKDGGAKALRAMVRRAVSSRFPQSKLSELPLAPPACADGHKK